jgi:hypothetical protein
MELATEVIVIEVDAFGDGKKKSSVSCSPCDVQAADRKLEESNYEYSE